jgi:hypothetical protein
MSLDADYMLALTENNCEYFEQLLASKMGALKKETNEKIEAFYPQAK